MSQKWAERQRRTNKLVRLVATHVLRDKTITPDQIYGICKLTWITHNHDVQDAPYIWSTKIPALGCILSRNYNNWTLNDVADDVAARIDSDEVVSLVQTHTGFTNLYKPYRNSCLDWLGQHCEKINRLFQRALTLKTDSEGLALIEEIKTMPGVPKANTKGSLMKPENLLTPALFALDSRIRFPLINGNKGVKNLLIALGAAESPLDEVYNQLIKLLGDGGITDAADLDQIGHGDLSDFIKVGTKGPSKKLLDKKLTKGNKLPLKDESDLEALQQAMTVTHRRLHNTITNKLKELLAEFTLLEGSDSSALFDVLVKNYNTEDEDLLIEAKSSVEAPHVRMAVGQLFDYWFHIKGTATPHLAILTPQEPDSETTQMLNWLEIGVLWIEDGTLQTSSDWLKCLCFP